MSSNAIQKAKPAANVIAAVATSQIFPDLANPTLACILNCPGSNRLEQKKFGVNASGSLTCATAGYTGLVSLYAALVAPGTPLVAANWTLLGATAAAAIGVGTIGFNFDAALLFDSISGKLQGTFSSDVGNAPGAVAAIANQVTGINGATEPVLVFALGVTFSTGAATNIGRLANFSLEA